MRVRKRMCANRIDEIWQQKIMSLVLNAVEKRCDDEKIDDEQRAFGEPPERRKYFGEREA